MLVGMKSQRALGFFATGLPDYSSRSDVFGLCGKAKFLAGLRNLAKDARFHQSLYSRKIVPKTFALFDRYAEFRNLGDRVRGYSPGGAA